MTTIVIPVSGYDTPSLLEIVRTLARDVGMAPPDQVVGSTEREWIEALDYANRVGLELMRRVDWGRLVVNTTLSGTGTSQPIDLPADWVRMCQGAAVMTGTTPIRQMGRAEWNTLTQAQGTPRYFLLEGAKISFWPYLASGASASISYISGQWSSSGYDFSGDTDTAVFPDDLMVKGLITHWRRQKGMDYADYEAEYEAALADFAAFDARPRY